MDSSCGEQRPTVEQRYVLTSIPSLLLSEVGSIRHRQSGLSLIVHVNTGSGAQSPESCCPCSALLRLFWTLASAHSSLVPLGWESCQLSVYLLPHLQSDLLWAITDKGKVGLHQF